MLDLLKSKTLQSPHKEFLEDVNIFKMHMIFIQSMALTNETTYMFPKLKA